MVWFGLVLFCWLFALVRCPSVSVKCPRATALTLIRFSYVSSACGDALVCLFPVPRLLILFPPHRSLLVIPSAPKSVSLFLVLRLCGVRLCLYERPPVARDPAPDVYITSSLSLPYVPHHHNHQQHQMWLIFNVAHVLPMEYGALLRVRFALTIRHRFCEVTKAYYEVQCTHTILIRISTTAVSILVNSSIFCEGDDHRAAVATTGG